MLRLTDRLPESGGVDAIYVPGLGLVYNRTRLTALNRVCMEEAVRTIKGGTKLIISGCYGGEVMEKELALRWEIVRKARISSGLVREIRGIASTDDELIKLARVLDSINAKSLLLISDEYHMPRLVRWAALRLEGIEIFNKSVRPPSYDFVCEPSLIKVIRSGVKPLWILWNMILYYATPLFIRK
ncbi:MAG: YdcF family protein [Candidatus Yanofskybacteria bacterium]|nr:YdcF family protein [Candidatus Yanofskybacteria bacterium]